MAYKIWSILGLTLIILIYILPWRFQVNDDVIMMWLISGAYTGTPEDFVFFIHPYFSTILSHLYQLTDSIQWYQISIFGLLASSYIVGVKTIKSLYQSNSSHVWYSIHLLITLHFCIFPQFTLVAGWAFLQGLLAIHFIQSVKINKWKTLSTLLLIFGALIRIEACLLILIGYVIFNPILISRTHWKEVVFPILLLSASFLSQKHYEKNSEFEVFLKFNRARHHVIDHPVFYQKASNDEIDHHSKWYYFSNWLMEDTPIETPELRTFKIQLDKEYFTLSHITASINRLNRSLLLDFFKSFLIGVLITIFLYSYKNDKRAILIFICWIIFFLSFNHFYIIRGRVIFLFFLPMLYPLYFKKSNFQHHGYWGSVILLLFFSIHFTNFMLEAKKRSHIILQYENLTQNLEQAPIKLEGMPLEYFSTYFNRKEKVPFILDGWLAKSTYQKSAFHRLGFLNQMNLFHFYFIGIKETSPFIYPDYLKFLGNEVTLIQKLESEDLVLYEFKSKSSLDPESL